MQRVIVNLSTWHAQDYRDCYYYIPFEKVYHIDDETLMDLRFWIGDFVFKIFFLFDE